MKQLSFADKPTLIGQKVTLRPVGEDDAVGMLAIDPQSLRLTGTHATFTEDQLRQWYRTRGEQADRLDLAIVENASGRTAGEVVLSDLDPDNRSCGFRIVLLGPEFFGGGLGSEATELILAHAFESVGVNQVGLEVYDFNPRARQVYLNAGFVHEGTLRQALRWNGQWIDAHVMGLLATDWAARRR